VAGSPKFNPDSIVSNPFVIGAAVLIGLLVLLYNGLVRRKNQIAFANATVDTLLKKRHDLVPNLVATVRGYMAHEHSLFERITELRASARALPLSNPERIQVENGLAAALSTVFARVEAYPQLRANENVLHLQISLNEIEEQISAARRFFNSAVTDYNNAVQTFPSNLVASWFRFQQTAFFEIPEIERAVPNVTLRRDVPA
jgi:LemA protein